MKMLFSNALIIEEEFTQDATDNNWMRQFEKPTRQLENKDSNMHSKGFFVAKAPWDVSSSEALLASSKLPAWGAARR